jgi:hypothetical protein
VHHTDSACEYAYDRRTHFGMLDKALGGGSVEQLAVTGMKNDGKRIFGFG